MELPCYNREPFRPLVHKQIIGGAFGVEVITTTVEHRMSQDCGSWKDVQDQAPLPLRARWNCNGCRWLPPEHAAAMIAIHHLGELRVGEGTAIPQGHRP